MVGGSFLVISDYKYILLLLILGLAVQMTTNKANAYSIGTPGQPWGVAEYKQWKDTRIKERCYHTNVVPAVQALSDKYDVIEYGQLSNDTDGDKNFPLFAVRSKEWSDDKPNVFITGGVHGYETVSSYMFVYVVRFCVIHDMCTSYEHFCIFFLRYDRVV